jgi:hypothetical protein
LLLAATCAGTGVYTKPNAATAAAPNPIPSGQGASFTCCTSCSDNTAPCCNTDANNVYVTGASYSGNDAQSGTGKIAKVGAPNPIPNSRKHHDPQPFHIFTILCLRYYLRFVLTTKSVLSLFTYSYSV